MPLLCCPVDAGGSVPLLCCPVDAVWALDACGSVAYIFNAIHHSSALVFIVLELGKSLEIDWSDANHLDPARKDNSA